MKALPQPSKTYGETVCCAGVTVAGEWKRLFPVRFRHLKGEHSFSRWDWVEFTYGRPTRDHRTESCHVQEESIAIKSKLVVGERARLLNPLIVGSSLAAAERGQSLALIRPRNTRFMYRPKSAQDMEDERAAYRKASRQMSLLDKELEELEPSPYEFRFQFDDDAGRHDYENGDWEAHAMFWREAHRTSAADALRWMSGVFNEDYPRRGMAFAIGNQAKRPHVWQLLGVIRLDELDQPGLPL